MLRIRNAGLLLPNSPALALTLLCAARRFSRMRSSRSLCIFRLYSTDPGSVPSKLMSSSLSLSPRPPPRLLLHLLMPLLASVARRSYFFLLASASASVSPSCSTPSSPSSPSSSSSKPKSSSIESSWPVHFRLFARTMRIHSSFSSASTSAASPLHFHFHFHACVFDTFLPSSSTEVASISFPLSCPRPASSSSDP